MAVSVLTQGGMVAVAVTVDIREVEVGEVDVEKNDAECTTPVVEGGVNVPDMVRAVCEKKSQMQT